MNVFKSIKDFSPVYAVFLQSLFVHDDDQFRFLRHFTNAACCWATSLQLQKQGPDFVTVPRWPWLCWRRVCLNVSVKLWKPGSSRQGVPFWTKTSAWSSALPAETCSSPFKKTVFLQSPERNELKASVFLLRLEQLHRSAIVSPSSSSALWDSHGSVWERSSPGSGFTLCCICAQLWRYGQALYSTGSQRGKTCFYWVLMII